ncbi:hypothetical protein FB45DRAFT_1008768 [Roridomyces roridus]|uniref:Protein kinase domain-containing protein n=1 Tax=Roridomyces roridus TaxID=1738132 RepID=A0AAD7FDI5_9AGAR|nr:hypothetical protein FB45DRAFT_1008768 [Roridomyces roridus]
MAFISNASGFSLGEGTFNNIHGNLNIYHGTKRRREGNQDTLPRENQDGLKIIRDKNLRLTLEIGRGPGYLLHAGKIKDRAVIVKVFNAGKNAREHLEATALVSRGLLHPNVLRIKGTSAPTSIHHFIVYEDAHRNTAEGPLAAALRDDLDKSIVLGFKLISSLSSGIDYLNTQGISLPLGPESFDVFLDIEDRFLFSINPPIGANATRQEQEDTRGVWTLFNALCQKVLRSANRILHDEDIERTPAVFDAAVRSPALSQLSLAPALDQAIIQIEAEATPADRDEVPSVRPRREYVWRTMDAPQSLASIATQIARDLDLRRAAINRLVRSDGRSIHRCPGYIREEVTLATRTADSAVVSHDAPTVQEVCSVCHEVVTSGEVFRCVCGQNEPGLRPTVKCRSCKSWSHRDCAPFANESICYFCFFNTSDIPFRAEDLFVHEQDGEAATETNDFSFAADIFQDNTHDMPDRADGAPESNHPLNVIDALSYLDAVKAQFWDRPEVYNHLLDMMKDFKNQVALSFHVSTHRQYRIDTPGTIHRVSQLFRGNPSLIRGFDTFLPHINVSQSGHTITVATPTGTSIPNTDYSHDQHSRIAPDIPGFGSNIVHPMPFAVLPPIGNGPGSHSPTLLYHVPHPPQVSSQATFEPPPFGGENPNYPQMQTNAATSFLGNLNNSSNHAPENHPAPGVEFNHAIQYLNRIKARYTDDLSTYKQFLDILQAYQKDQIPIPASPSYVRVQHLFRDAPDLLDEFKMFLPGGLPHHQPSAPRPMDERPLKKIRL